jgi:hypothetical protein
LDQVVQAVLVAQEQVEAPVKLGDGLAHLPFVLPQRTGNGLRHPALPEAKAEDQAGQGKLGIENSE